MKKYIRLFRSLDFFEVFRHGSVYMLSYMFIQVISFLTLPIITKLLLPEDFGVVEVFLQLSRILGILFSLNLYSGLSRFIYDKNVSREQLVSFSFSAATLFTFVISAIFLLFGKTVTGLLNIPSQLLLPLLIYIWLNNITGAFFTAICFAENQSLRFAIWSIVLNICKIAASILLLVYWKQNFLGRIYGEVISTSVIVLITIVVFMRKYFSRQIFFPQYKEVLKYSIGFIPITLSSFILTYFDTMIINVMKGNSDAGLYSFAYKIAVIYSGVSMAYMNSVRPKLFQELQENKTAEVIKSQLSLVKLITFYNISILLFSRDIGIMLSSNVAYRESLNILPAILLGCFFFDLTELYNFYITYEKKIKYFFYTLLTSGIINILLNIWLIPIYGYKIASVTTLISYFFLLITTYWVCKKHIAIAMPGLFTLLSYSGIVLLAAGLYYVIGNYVENYVLSLIIRVLFLMLAALFLWRNLLRLAFKHEQVNSNGI